jgi:RNA polymerase sigma-70 factor, ECF subfamily
METFDSAPDSPQGSEEPLRKLLAIDVDTYFKLLVQTYHNEVRGLVQQLINATQPEQIAVADAIAAEIFIRMYSDLKNLKPDEILEQPIWTRLYEIVVARSLGQLLKKYESQMYSSVQRLNNKSRLEQSREVIVLAEEIFTRIRQELSNCDLQVIQTPEVWVWLHNIIIAHYFEQLLETYRPQLEAFALRLSGNVDNAQDTVQDALFNAFKFLKEHGIPDKKDTFDPKHWIFQITKHEFLKSLRKTLPPGKEIPISQAPENHPIFEIVDDRNVPPDVVLEIAENQKRVMELVNKLPEPYRTIIRLRYFANLSGAEIAARLVKKEVTVRTYIHRGIKLLRKLLEQE